MHTARAHSLAMAAALAVLGLCASVSVAAYEDVFTYVKPNFFRRFDDNDCKICYGDNDCFTMNQARCEFNMAANEMLFEDDGPEESSNSELRVQVDSLMMGLAEQSYNLLASQECIPFVSLYTDCTKENIGLGCRSCTCSEGSMWNCTVVQRFRPEEQLDLDHRALVVAIKNLGGNSNEAFRLKRSISTSPAPKPYNITFEEIAQWMYGVEPSYNDVYANTTEATSTIETTESNFDVLTTDNGDIKTTDNIETDNVKPDYIAFDDVFNNTSIQNKSYTQQNSPSTTLFSDILDHDYMSFDDANVTLEEFNDVRKADRFVHILNAIGNVDEVEETTTTEGVTKVVIDLLELARKRIDEGNDFNDTDKKVTLLNDTVFDDDNNMYEFNAINVMKRDVSQVIQNNLTDSDTDKINNGMNSSKELKEDVYLPINAIIKDKQKELEDLLRVREKLVEILKLNHSKEYVVLNKSEIVENGSNSYISFYNVQIVPQTEYDSKRSGVDLLDKYLKKLKRDIYVVIRDIVSIQAITGAEDFPKNLKGLTRAIKHFMRNHTKSHRKSKLQSFNNIPNLRRFNQDSGNISKDFVRNYLVNILVLIDSDTPESNALDPLSIKTRKIIKRVLRNSRSNDFSLIGLRINDPNYNLTNDLKSIGVNWQEMTVKISESSPWDRLHHMKLLQLNLETDIGKMKDALALIDFAYSRRMVAYQDDVDKDELLRININLRSIHTKIRDISKLRPLNKPERKIVKIFTIAKQSKKETFLKHIRRLLSSSKTDIINLLRKKVPKSEIVKQLAKKKLNEMTRKKLMEYENVMQRWQNDLDITRKKRSFAYEKLTNILPKYLRGKVSSKMNSTKHKNKPKPKYSERQKGKKNNKSKISVAATTVKNQKVNRLDNKQLPKTKNKKTYRKNTPVLAKKVTTQKTIHTNKTSP